MFRVISTSPSFQFHCHHFPNMLKCIIVKKKIIEFEVIIIFRLQLLDCNT
uniref:Uncharacterized protein n=1 Tax=Rhizophora mucronata TaxID=61149 RepID=A0A2P2MVU0_RHIMU